jgi:hypothetical protein
MQDATTPAHSISDPSHRDVPRIGFGLVLMALGGALLLSKLDFLPMRLHVGELWPLVFLVIAFIALSKLEIGRFLVFTGLAAMFLLPKFRPDIHFTDIIDQWPLFLVAIGVWTVVRSFLPKPVAKVKDGGSESSSEARPGSLAVFRTITWRPTSQAYRGDQVSAVVGGYKLDLGRATPAPEGAVVDVFTFWGGVEIQVPQDWAVDVRVMPFMGGVDEKGRSGRPLPADAPRLLIRGFVIMGGLEVKR